MSTTTDRAPVSLAETDGGPLAPAKGLELLGEVPDSGYRKGIALVRRADGQMVQLGPLQYALLEEVDGRRDAAELASALCAKLGRACDEQHVVAIADKLGQQGLLAGSEANAPQRSNPLLALRWKVVVTNPELTRRLTAPFMALFRPVVLVPVLVAFVAACWFVLVDQGVASGFAQAFARPELILLLFVLGVASAGFHELGHATACRYGGGRPGAMGAGIYLVWPAFYTDVTDSYRLSRRARLRTDFGGLYFNAIVAVATVVAWFVVRADALLLLVGLQVLEMVKQLSPVIRADGYHILSDATGVPDLYAHIGPTLRRLLPGQRRSPSALTGRARVLVTLWVLVIVPILLGVAFSAILLLPKLAASTWVSGSQVLSAMGSQLGDAQLVDAAVSVLRLLGLALPVLGMALIAKRVVGGVGGLALRWSRGRPGRRAFISVLAAGTAALLLWAWWPAGQYEPIRASDRGTIGQVGQLVATEPAASRTALAEQSRDSEAQVPAIPTGTHVAVSLIPDGGATETDPAIFIITDPRGGGTPIIITSATAPSVDGAGASDTGGAAPPTTSNATAFAFDLPDAPGEDDSQALAVNRTDGGTTYSIAYSLVTVRDGDPVDQRNGAHAYANCVACTTIAVSFQVVLVVGDSSFVAPINIAEALNGNCPTCVTTAIAHQIVVSVGSEPSAELIKQLNAELERLDALDDLGADTSPTAIVEQVSDVQQGINDLLAEHGLLPAAELDEADASSTQPGDEVDGSVDGDAATDTANTTDETVDPAAEPTDTTVDPTTTEDGVGSTPDGTDPTTSEASTTP